MKTVLDVVKCQWPGCDLSDKVLTYKVVILITLSCVCRASAINHSDIRYMFRPEGKFEFTFHKLHKNWKYGKPPPVLSLGRPLCCNNFE